MIVRHAIALAATLGALAVSPFLSQVISGWLSHVFGDEDESHFLALTWSPGNEGALDNIPLGLEPASLAVMVVVATIVVVCLIGDILVHKWSPLSWGLPLFVAVPFGLCIVLLTRGADLPGDAVATIAITLGLLAFLLVGTYWWTLRAMSVWWARGKQ